MTASAPALTVNDLHAAIASAEADIESLNLQRSRQAPNALRRLKGAEQAWADVDAKLTTRLRELAQLRDAVLALEGEEAEQVAKANEAERERLEQVRVNAEKVLHDRLLAVDHALEALVETVQPARAASDDFYHSGVNLGMQSGVSKSTGDRGSMRISHVLRLAGLPAFDLSLSPSGRSPLAGEAKPLPVPLQPARLPAPRDTKADT